MLGRIFARNTATTRTLLHQNIIISKKMSISRGPPDSNSSSGGGSSGAGGGGGQPSTSELRALLAMMEGGISPKVLLNHLAPSFHIPPGANDMMLWRLLVSMIEPPKRRELSQYKTIEDAVELIRKSKKILVLSGAGISTSAGLPDFRSRNGIYVQIHAQHPDLHDPKSMFDIEYFRENPVPFYQFAKALYPGQYKPTIGHQFIKCIEDHNKLLRNYSQNIDTLEKQAGIKRVVECHGSFARATCTNCKYSVDGDEIRDDIMNQKIPYCPSCQAKEDGPEDGLGVMKPNIVFFGEQLGDDFHSSLETDKEQADLLIVIGSSLKVKPVALIPKCVPAEVPQILINKEPLDHMGFDIELLGNCDDIIQELCLRLDQRWTNICEPQKTRLTPIIGLATNETNHSESNTSATTSNADQQPRPSSNRGEQTNHRTTRSSTGDRSEPSNSATEDKTPVTGDKDDNNDADDDDDWEDIEIIDSSPGSSNAKAKANLNIPNSSFIYMKPKTYLFPGAELTNGQLEDYLKESQSSEDTFMD